MASWNTPQQDRARSDNNVIHERGFRSMGEFMHAYGLTQWNDENVATAHQIIDRLRSYDTQTSVESHSADYSEMSDYAIMREQGFSGMKDFMESHGLRLWDDEDVQTAHQIIDGMREYHEYYDDLPNFIEESDAISAGQVDEDEMRGASEARNTYGPSDIEDEQRIIESQSCAEPQQEVMHDSRPQTPEILGRADVEGGEGYSPLGEEDPSHPDLGVAYSPDSGEGSDDAEVDDGGEDNEGGYDDDYDGYDDDYGEDDGYDYDDDDDD